MTNQEAIPVYLGEPMTYSIEELEAKAINFLKRNKKKMTPVDRQELAHLKAEAAKRYAENMIAQGTPDFVAWPMAIRLEILESESD